MERSMLVEQYDTKVHGFNCSYYKKQDTLFSNYQKLYWLDYRIMRDEDMNLTTVLTSHPLKLSFRMCKNRQRSLSNNWNTHHNRFNFKPLTDTPIGCKSIVYVSLKANWSNTTTTHRMRTRCGNAEPNKNESKRTDDIDQKWRFHILVMLFRSRFRID